MDKGLIDFSNQAKSWYLYIIRYLRRRSRESSYLPLDNYRSEESNIQGPNTHRSLIPTTYLLAIVVYHIHSTNYV